MNRLRLLSLLALWSLTGIGAADTRVAIDRLASATSAPEGVVFEILVFEDDAWRWAAPLLGDSVERLRRRYPDIELALISFGAEMFELTAAAGLGETPQIRLLASLQAAGMSVHVDREFARWKRLDANHFLPFVDIADSARALLEDYRRLGFTAVRLEPPHGAD